ncbi:hypothetical protein PsyrCH409_16765 [Pseudomonas viridiflava]|uniref:hypothetical protein n=1 Tax=Pseudomonas viridiflava TaxID=33069 RepID=UPI000BBDB4FB|nr:hypothetical protein [Pseudomonas viridiflava]PCK90888.1 hypothetical protein PsyrCH409_16765 [Pseudomonas viridiflava]
MNISEPQALIWVRWWAQGWRDAHSSWQLLEQANASTLHLLEQVSAQSADRCLGMTSAIPPMPEALLIPLLDLAPQEWTLALRLGVTVCAGTHRPRTADLDESAHLWCRRLGKGLQPGCWMPEQWSPDPCEVAGLSLLRRRVGERLWQRLRLRFDRTAVEEAERMVFEEVPAVRLRALWQAIAGYVLNARNEGNTHVDPSQSEPSS